ncbi:MAG TPA: helix-turn-helix transcriptional regulator [Longimicrobium sp.]|nr:helix-turn-helix transcriptional regulator [Longimicrobium sp.]
MAREIGISAGGLKNFLEGATPYARTATALREWYRSGASEQLPPRAQAARPPVLEGIREDVLRAALRRAAEEITLRAVAGQVGMTHAGLQRYIEGKTRPRDATLRKLRAWYLREAGNWTGTGEGTARAALAVLLDGLPPAEQDRAAAEISVLVRNAYARVQISPPEWLAKVA